MCRLLMYLLILLLAGCGLIFPEDEETTSKSTPADDSSGGGTGGSTGGGTGGSTGGSTDGTLVEASLAPLPAVVSKLWVERRQDRTGRALLM